MCDLRWSRLNVTLDGEITVFSVRPCQSSLKSAQGVASERRKSEKRQNPTKSNYGLAKYLLKLLYVEPG